MHASIILTTVALAATAFAGPLLETRACPIGPYKEGSSCSAECLGALKCSDNLYDVIQCVDYTWQAFDHCEAPICYYGSC